MTSSVIRKKTHQYLDTIDDAMLKSIYAMLKEYRKNHGETFMTDEQKAELDERIGLHKAGKSKSYNWEEVKTKITSKIKKK